MYGTGVVLALDDQHVRLYCCMCVLELGGVVDDRHSMHEVVIIHYNDDDGSTLIFVR